MQIWFLGEGVWGFWGGGLDGVSWFVGGIATRASLLQRPRKRQRLRQRQRQRQRERGADEKKPLAAFAASGF
ncbi:MAG: hypothetical protein CFE38_13470 [Comamonadaceae bacterium PBBC1]|nr:MAG: hypothetical protein CFE38_13470 [Comamonadaceae bacterium PBBC1]